MRPEAKYEYAGSASSPGWRETADTDRFVFTRPEDTEVERLRRKSERDSSDAKRERAGATTPVQRRIPPDVAAHPLAAKLTLLPRTVGFGPLQLTVNRKRCEDALLLAALAVAIAKLGYGWNEWALAAELSTLFAISIVYVRVRVRPGPVTATIPRPKSPSMSHVRGKRSIHAVAAPPEDDVPAGIGSVGCIWGTEEREYRWVGVVLC